MVIRENALRLSPATQAYYAHLEIEPRFDNQHSDWVDYTATLQKQVLVEFGFQPDDYLALIQLRSATRIYPQLKDLVHYVKYNRARKGDLTDGDLAPNVELRTMDLQSTSLHRLVSIQKPLLVCAVSWT